MLQQVIYFWKKKAAEQKYQNILQLFSWSYSLHLVKPFHHRANQATA
jgi:hypothetical protein